MHVGLCIRRKPGFQAAGLVSGVCSCIGGYHGGDGSRSSDARLRGEGAGGREHLFEARVFLHERARDADMCFRVRGSGGAGLAVERLALVVHGDGRRRSARTVFEGVFRYASRARCGVVWEIGCAEGCAVEFRASSGRGGSGGEIVRTVRCREGQRARHLLQRVALSSQVSASSEKV